MSGSPYCSGAASPIAGAYGGGGGGGGAQGNILVVVASSTTKLHSRLFREYVV